MADAGMGMHTHLTRAPGHAKGSADRSQVVLICGVGRAHGPSVPAWCGGGAGPPQALFLLRAARAHGRVLAWHYIMALYHDVSPQQHIISYDI